MLSWILDVWTYQCPSQIVTLLYIDFRGSLYGVADIYSHLMCGLAFNVVAPHSNDCDAQANERGLFQPSESFALSSTTSDSLLHLWRAFLASLNLASKFFEVLSTSLQVLSWRLSSSLPSSLRFQPPLPFWIIDMTSGLLGIGEMYFKSHARGSPACSFGCPGIQAAVWTRISLCNSNMPLRRPVNHICVRVFSRLA